MKQLRIKCISVSILLLLLSACGNSSGDQKSGSAITSNKREKLQMVSSFTIISDIIRQVGGDRVEVHNLAPTGTDPHEYEPLPEDIKAATDADILVKNGLNLEGGDHGWFAKLIRTVGQEKDHIFQLTDGVEPMYLTGKDGREEEINPHAFLSPVVGIKMGKNARDALIEADPDHEKEYFKNAESYLKLLNSLEEEYRTKIAEIPEENRVLVTSERAFQYLAAEYGLKEGYIWAIDTEDNGTPKQLKSLLSFLEEHKVPALFLETNVDKRPMQTVSRESGIEIYGPIYSDEIGEPGAEIDTYEKYLRYNIKQIYEGLLQDKV